MLVEKARWKIGKIAGRERARERIREALARDVLGSLRFTLKIYI